MKGERAGAVKRKDQRHAETNRTYDRGRQIRNPFQVKPHPLAESLFVASNTSSKNLFSAVRFHPKETPEKMLRLGPTDTSKRKPSTGCQTTPNNGNHERIKTEVGHEPALAGFHPFFVVESHDLRTKLLEILGRKKLSGASSTVEGRWKKGARQQAQKAAKQHDKEQRTCQETCGRDRGPESERKKTGKGREELHGQMDSKATLLCLLAKRMYGSALSVPWTSVCLFALRKKCTRVYVVRGWSV